MGIIMQDIFEYRPASTGDAKQLRALNASLWAKFKEEFESQEEDAKDFYIPLSTYGYTATLLKTKAPAPSSVDEHDEIEGLLAASLRALCADRLARYRRFMGGITYDGWGMEIEVNYYPFRSNHGGFGLHKDDYFREGVHHDAEGGVMFVSLIYLVEYPVFGPEVMLDGGSKFDFAELTLAQIASLPPSFCRRIIASKESLLSEPAASRRVHCPIIEPWSEVLFCDTLAIHQTPATSTDLTPPKLTYNSHNPVAGAASDEERSDYNDRGKRFELNTRSSRQVPLELDRELAYYYNLRATNWYVKRVFENTETKARSFLRLTFRARKP
jgi:hypothetical protein